MINNIFLHIGLDDTDSENGMCTTYLGTKIVEFFIKNNFRLLDYPLLIRLNPNIPYKTRGNGAVCIRVEVPEKQLEEIKFHIKKIFDNLYERTDPKGNTNPGLVFLEGKMDKTVIEFSKKALIDFIDLKEVYPVIENNKVEFFSYNNGYGVIGALAAIGSLLIDEDYSFELLAYRDPKIKKVERNENSKKIWEVIKNNPKFEDTFSHADVRNGILKIIPHGPDPVFCGIRGNSSKGIISFWKAIQPQPEPQSIMIFRSNQATEVHLNKAIKRTREATYESLLPYQVINLHGYVNSLPTWRKGGHLSFIFRFNNSTIPCYAYEPTKEFRKVISLLLPGDKIQIGGNVRAPSSYYPKCINLEKLEILKLIKDKKELNPFCNKCNKRVKSLGKNQGYRCPKCRNKYSIPPLKKDIIEKPRQIDENAVYLPSLSAQRHLTMPFGREKQKRKFSFDFETFLFEINELQDKEKKEKS